MKKQAIRRRKGDWMQTYTGVEFYPLDPHPNEIRVQDIAHALAYSCRYGGHCTKYYSVAEHSVLVARAAPLELKLVALMHDASEAYLSDVIRPIKPHLAGYNGIEEALMHAIAGKFGFAWPMPDEVKRLDNAILADERDQIMATPPRDWCLFEPPLGITIDCWHAEKAELEFLFLFAELSDVR